MMACCKLNQVLILTCTSFLKYTCGTQKVSYMLPPLDENLAKKKINTFKTCQGRLRKRRRFRFRRRLQNEDDQSQFWKWLPDFACFVSCNLKRIFTLSFISDYTNYTKLYKIVFMQWYVFLTSLEKAKCQNVKPINAKR